MDQINGINTLPVSQELLKQGYVSAKTLSKYLDIPVSTIRAWIIKRTIPFRKIGVLVRFDLAEIERWIESANPKLPRKEL